MPRKQHVVRLAPEDRQTLTTLTRTGTRSAGVIQRARVLLAADANAPGRGRTDREVAEQVGVATRTVARIRAAWVDQGIACIDRKVRATPPVAPKLSTTQVLQIAHLACTAPPPGFATWSLRLLADRAVELEIVDAISHETIRRTLKKTTSAPGSPSAS